MALSGDRVFIGADMRPLIVADVSNPQRPFTRQQVPKVGLIRSLQVEGDYLFVAGPSIGLAAYHAFLPDGLKLASKTSGFAGSQDIEVVGDRIYVAGGSGGLTVVEYQVGIEQTVPNLPTNSRTAIGTALDLPAISDAGLPVRYTVVEGNALIEGGKLRLSHEGYVMIRADVEGDLQFFPTSAELKFEVLRPPTLVMEPTADGPKLRWRLGFGDDFLEVSESIHGPWQWVPIESPEYLEGNQIRVSTGATSPSPLFYRVSRR
jgi:hypothetical protein